MKKILFIISLLIFIATIAFGNKYLKEPWVGRAWLEQMVAGVLAGGTGISLDEIPLVNSIEDSMVQYHQSLIESFLQFQSPVDSRIFMGNLQELYNPDLSAFGSLPDVEADGNTIICELKKESEFEDEAVKNAMNLSQKTLEWLYEDSELSTTQAYQEVVYEHRANPGTLEKTCQYIIDKNVNSEIVNVGELQYAVLLSQIGSTKMQAQANQIDANRRLIKVLRNRRIIDGMYYDDIRKEIYILAGGEQK